MRQNLFILLLALTVVMLSCSTEDADTGGPRRTLVPMGFAAVESGASHGATRAAGDLALPQLKSGTGFGVFAAYTGLNRYTDSSVSPDFMYNQQVTWEDDVWTYEPVKYWPSGETDYYVSFFAYGPYSDLDSSDPATNPAGYCISGFSNAHAQGDPWLTYRLIPQAQLDHQVDLVYARTLDQTRPASVEDKVQMSFDHALACVGDVVCITVSDAMKTLLNAHIAGGTTSVELRLTDVSVSYTLTAKGRLSLWDDGSARWQPVLSEAVTTQLTPTLTQPLPQVIYSYDGSTATTTDWEDRGHGIFCIPLEVEGHVQQVRITVAYQVVLNGAVVFAEHEQATTTPITNHLQAGARLALKASLTPPS